MALRVIPLTRTQAQSFIEKHHRHLAPSVGDRFCLGAVGEDGALVAAIQVGRPVATMADQWQIAEVTRLASDGTKNACSLLYGAAARVAKHMGFDEIWTYTLRHEPGTSLVAAGWQCDGPVKKKNKTGRQNREGRQAELPGHRVKWRRVFR